MLRGAEQWLFPYLRSRRHAVRLSPASPLHACIAVCDHYEPLHDTDLAGAQRAVGHWRQTWPGIVSSHRDSAGRGPRHTFFYPIEQYEKTLIAPLADLCAQTGSEVEIHLHHDGDTRETLTAKLRQGVADLASHGLLSRDAAGRAGYVFIHGNWALDHSHPSGRKCGVPDELAALRETGCYADMTMPAAPDPCQTPIVNAAYYAREDGQPCSHHQGTPVRTGHTAPLRDLPDHLLLLQGPLGLNWRWRKWGLIPRLENGDASGSNPPTLNRLKLWLSHCPRVQGGPPWVFIKLHTHGGIPKNYNILLGEAMQRFYRDLAAFASATPGFHYHFVTARELVNLLHAAEDGKTGSPAEWLDYCHPRPPVLGEVFGKPPPKGQ
jgi:hypothetical protein